MVLSMETYRITVTVRQRSDLDVPSSIDEAVSMVHNLLTQGSMLDVVSVEPLDKQTKTIPLDDSAMKWG